MTVPSEVNSVSYSGNGTTTAFAIPYYFLENSHIKVILRSSAGVETLWVINVNYTLTGAGVQAGGTLTATVAPATGTTLVISRNVPATQETDYPANDPFPSSSHERALDKLTMIVQQNTSGIKGTIRVPDTDPEPTRLPTASSRANLLFSFDSAGNPAVTAPVSGSAADLALNLLNSTDPAKGAALIGYKGLTLSQVLANEINPRMYGAVGNGTTDDTAALVAMYADAVAIPAKIVDFSGKTYRYTSNIVVTGNISIQGDCTFFGDNVQTTFQGSLTSVGNISAATTLGDDAFTASSVTGLATNDLLILHNQVASSYSIHRAEYFDGEFIRVHSIAGSVVNTQGNLLTTYAGVSTDKIFKVNTIRVDIQGVSFTGGDLYSLLIKYADGSYIAPKRISNTRGTTTSSAAIGLDKCYNTRIEGGRYVLPYVTGAGLSYGINVINCQRMQIVGVDAFGGRHAITTGGDSANGAVPCRHIHIEDSVLTNDPASGVYCADFHGNTIDSHYRNCEIYGRIGLAGEDVSAIGCTIWSEPGTISSPLGYHELVGGDLRFIDCSVYLGAGSLPTSIVSNLSSTLTTKISKPYKVFVTGLEAVLTTSVTTVVNAFDNSGQISSWFLDDFEVRGNPTGLTSFLLYTLVAPGIDPLAVETTRPRRPVAESFAPIARSGTLLTSTRLRMYQINGSNANGKFRKLEDGTMICTHKLISASTAIDTAYLTGDFRSGLVTWTFPVAFAEEPQTTGVPANASALSIAESTSSTTSFGFFFTAGTSQASGTREARLVATGRWGLA